MSYVNQIDAHLAYARGRLAYAERSADSNWPSCTGALARSLEYAVGAVLMAWGEPHKADRRVHRIFEERLAPFLDPLIVNLVSAVWDNEGSTLPPEQGDQLLAACRTAVETFATLAAGGPPPSWGPSASPPPISWGGLSGAERTYLLAATRAARERGAEVRLLLFGSRAVGRGREDSDYDLLLIFGDEVPEVEYGQSVGRVV